MSEPAGGKSGPKLHTKILVGLAVGAVAGVIVNLTLGADHPTIQELSMIPTRVH